LIARARCGELHRATCPNGHTAPFDTPLLIAIPESELGPAFMPQPGEKMWDSQAAYERLAKQYGALRSDERDSALPSFDVACLLDANSGKIPIGYEDHELPGTTRRLAKLVPEGQRSDQVTASGGLQPALADNLRNWEAVLGNAAFGLAPVWFRRGVLSMASAPDQGGSRSPVAKNAPGRGWVGGPPNRNGFGVQRT